MKTSPTAAISAFLVVIAFGANHVLAQSGHAGHHGHAPAASTSSMAAAPSLSEGKVRRVNASAGTVTIAHGPLANLDMPPMTMTFRVLDKGSLDGLSAGDSIRFAAQMDGDEFVVSEIEKNGD